MANVPKQPVVEFIERHFLSLYLSTLVVIGSYGYLLIASVLEWK